MVDYLVFDLVLLNELDKMMDGVAVDIQQREVMIRQKDKHKLPLFGTDCVEFDCVYVEYLYKSTKLFRLAFVI